MDLPLLPGGRRLDWERLSAPVREALQARLGSPVIHAATQPGGFSPGLAAAAEHGHDDLAGLDPWARRHLDRAGRRGADLAGGRRRRHAASP